MWSPKSTVRRTGEEGVSRALRVFPDSGRQAILSSLPAPTGGGRCLLLLGRRGQAEPDDLSRELVDVIVRTFAPAGSHDVNQPGGRINRINQAVSLANHPKASKAHEVFPERLSLRGNLPARQARLVTAWAEIHRAELLENWEALQAGRHPAKIDPLR